MLRHLLLRFFEFALLLFQPIELPANELPACGRQRVRSARRLPRADGLDDFAACGFETEEKLIGQFVDQFYFGCEADDPINAWAFARNHLPHGVQLNTRFGSDIGHFDVRDMAGVLTEAHELVDDGLIDRNNFRDFVFENAVRFLSRNNRNFFAGTTVEKPVSDYWEHAERL